VVFKLLSIILVSFILAGCGDRSETAPSTEGAQRFVKLRGFNFDKEGFFAATTQRDVAAINAFIAGKFDPNVQDANDGRTALINAAARGHLEVVNALLAGGADVNIKDKSGRTALFHALEARYDEVSDALVAQPKLDLNARGLNGVTALMTYVWRERPDIVKQLLDRGADANLKDNDGDTALHGAAQLSNVEPLRLLLTKGAKPNERNKVGGTPLMWAAVHGNDEAVKELLKAGADPNLKDEDGVTAHAWAVRNNRTSTAQLLRK
jgi:uncharacterized protein